MRDYQTKSNVGGVADSISATRFGGGEFNSIAVELENAVESSDQTLAPADGTGEVDTQLAMALSIYGAGGAQYMEDTGAANAYVLDPVSPKVAAPALFDGYTIIFEPGNVNTGASTVNVNSIGVKSITMEDGTAVPAGYIDGVTTIKYDLSNDRFEMMGNAIGTMSITLVTASGNYNPPPNVRALEFIAIGGGGGGGGVDGQGAGTAAQSTGGGGGGAAIAITSIIESSYTISIGAGGTGGAAGNNNGSAGGTTTVTSTNVNLSCTGGNGGTGMLATSGSTTGAAAGGGLGSGGDISISGIPSSFSAVISGTGLVASVSGHSILLGGLIAVGGTAGTSNSIYGGGGGSTSVNTVATDYAGGDGADGVVIVKEYY